VVMIAPKAIPIPKVARAIVTRFRLFIMTISRFL
jgi:hypothetical protein